MTEEIRPICLYIETCLHKKEGTKNFDKCEHHLNYWTEVMIRDMEKNIDRLKQENEKLRKKYNSLKEIPIYEQCKALEQENEKIRTRQIKLYIALDVIKDIAEKYSDSIDKANDALYSIIDKINEVIK